MNYYGGGRLGNPLVRVRNLKVVCGRCWRRIGKLPWPEPCPAGWGEPGGVSELDMFDWIERDTDGARSLAARHRRGEYDSRLEIVNTASAEFQVRGRCPCGARPILRLHNIKSSIVRDVLTLG